MKEAIFVAMAGQWQEFGHAFCPPKLGSWRVIKTRG